MVAVVASERAVAAHAAAAGVLACDLAGRGYTAPGQAILGEQGFAATHTDGADAAQLAVPFGQPWHILDDLFKAHASCYGTHATIDAVLRVRDAVGDTTVEAVEVHFANGLAELPLQVVELAHLLDEA